MSSFAERMTAARRQAILAALWLAAGYRMSVAQLRDATTATGHAAATDVLRADCAWLADVGLVVVDEGGVAELTERGMDVIQARAVVPGVREPQPGELAALQRSLVAAGLAAARSRLQG